MVVRVGGDLGNVRFQTSFSAGKSEAFFRYTVVDTTWLSEVPAAASLLASAAKLGHAAASYDLALLYLQGQQFPQDFNRAAELFRVCIGKPRHASCCSVSWLRSPSR